MSDERVHTIAVAQASAVVDDVAQNLATLESLVARARGGGAEIVVTPELFATGYAPDRAWRHDGGAIRASLADLARQHDIAIVASTVDSEPGAEATHRIAASFFDPGGVERARVHKRHLFGPVERQWMTPARDYGAIIDWRGSRFGLGICYDLEFPEFARALARRGAGILLIPTAVPTSEVDVNGPERAWHYSATVTSTLQVPTRALENGVVIAYANHCGNGFTGLSCIATPTGGTAVILDESEGIGIAQISPGAIARARALNPYVVDLGRD